MAADLEYVGFWLRVGAALIDTILSTVILLPLLHLIYDGHEATATWAWHDPMSYLLQGGNLFSWSDVLDLLIMAAGVVAFWIARQATPGKMIIGARIVDADSGAKPTSRQLIARYLGYYVSILPLCLGLLWVAFDPRKQGWHDKLAGTVVVRSKLHGRAAVGVQGGPMIRVSHLTKKFGDFTAVDDVSFAVAAGEIFAFLGPNGAGKTTTIKMLTTLLSPTSGTLEIDGMNPAANQHAVAAALRHRIPGSQPRSGVDRLGKPRTARRAVSRTP